jgi:hypothetical protein
MLRLLVSTTRHFNKVYPEVRIGYRVPLRFTPGKLDVYHTFPALGKG